VTIVVGLGAVVGPVVATLAVGKAPDPERAMYTIPLRIPLTLDNPLSPPMIKLKIPTAVIIPGLPGGGGA